MVIHIFRKDLRLLWPFIAGAALLQLVRLVIGLRLGIAPEGQSTTLYSYWGFACALASQLIIVLAVQQESLVGTQQDWLVRPVVRGQVLLAKLLFVVVAVQLPVFVFDLVLALEHGAPATATLAAALFNGLEQIVTIDLIAFITAAVTENLQQAIIFLLAIFIVKITAPELSRLLPNELYSFRRPAITWVPAMIIGLVTLSAACIIAPLQYFRRRTFTSRMLWVATIALLAVINFLPWDTAFAFDSLLSPADGPASAISIGYGAGIGRMISPRPVAPDDATIFLPLHIANLPAHSIVSVGNYRLRISDKDGQVIYRADMADYFPMWDRVGPKPADTLPALGMVAQNPQSHPIALDFYQSIMLPRQFLRLWKDRQVRLDVVYSVGLFQRGGVETIPAAGGSQYLPGFGQCASPPHELLGRIQFGVWCYAEAQAPHCLTVSVEDQAGQGNPDNIQCYPDFTPRWAKLAAPAEPGRQVAWYVFFDQSENFPVKSDQAGQSHFVLTAYQPQAYFTREYSSPEIRLGDLTQQFDPRFEAKPGKEYSSGPAEAPAPHAQRRVPAPSSQTCALNQPGLPTPLGTGTIIGIETPAAARAEIPKREARLGGTIDPRYVDDMRALVSRGNGRLRIFDVPAGMKVRIGDRVALQDSYRSKKLPCSYVPILITAVLRPAPQK